MKRPAGSPFAPGALQRDDDKVRSERTDTRANAILRLFRPQSAHQWRKWHINRGKARRLVDRQPDAAELTLMLGLDPDNEAELVRLLDNAAGRSSQRWGNFSRRRELPRRARG